MRLLLSAERIKEIEDYTINHIKLESGILMERAAVEVAFSVIERCPNVNTRICIVCGRGNNGADGLCVARILVEKGYSPCVFYKQGKTDLWNRQFEILSNMISFYDNSKCLLSDTFELSETYDVLIDALYGIGINRDLSEDDVTLINRLNAVKAHKISIDVPSGLNSTNGHIYNACFKADETICVGAMKKGLYLYKGPDYSGKVKIKEIGLAYSDNDEDFICLEKEDISSTHIVKVNSANKGTYGKTLVVGGSEGIYGAAFLTAGASLKAGAGMVKVITHINNKYSLEHDLPEAMYYFYDKVIDSIKIDESIKWSNTIVIGPGLSTDENANILINCILNSKELNSKILVIDADAINIIASDIEYLDKLKSVIDNCDIKCVFTPHKKELSRVGQLLKTSDEDSICRILYDKYSIVTINKDHNSLIYGNRIYINLTGNEGMATAGSGDVLSGILGGLLYRLSGEDFVRSCAVCAWIHGMCGDIYASEHNAMTLTATKLSECLSKALDFLT